MCKNKKFMWISIFILIAYLLTGCGTPPWESGMVLTLKVDSPRNNITVTTPVITVSGRVSGTERASATVTVNNHDIPVKDGRFSTDVTLTEGTNVINIMAMGGAAKLSETRTVIFTPSK